MTQPRKSAAASRRAARIRKTALATSIAWILAGTSFGAQAEASVLWTPTTTGRHAVELLVDDGGLELTVTQWPLPRAAVIRALDALPAQLPPSLDDARARVREELAWQQATLLTATVRGTSEALTGFGDDATPGSSIELRTGLLQGPHLAMQAGIRLDQASDPAVTGNRLRLDDTTVATEALGVQLQAFAHRAWWGPGWQNALALSNNAPSLGGVGLQRAAAGVSDSPWLSWLGPWNAETFVARAEGRSEPAYPFIVGSHFTFRPLPGVEIGLQRTAQWAGQGRDQSLHSFVDMYFGLNTNADTVAQQVDDPGNELAGYDLRIRCPGTLRCAGYGQAIGEDGAGFLPTKFLQMAGMEFWSADGRSRWFIEGTRTSCYTQFLGDDTLANCAYRNYAYPYGYTSGNRWIGSSVGPDSKLITLGWIDAEYDSAVRLHIGRVGSRIGTLSVITGDPDSAGRLVGLSARRSFGWGPARFTPELSWDRIEARAGTRNDVRASLEMQVDLDRLTSGASSRLGRTLSGDDPSAVTRLLVGAGLVGAAALLDHTASDYAESHVHDTSAIAMRHLGNGLPLVELGLAGLAAASWHGEPAGDVAWTALESGAVSVVAAEALKQVVDRSRPRDERGAADFGHARRKDSSFPSVHTALAWGLVTPVAEHYDAPWLYGVAALTNFARVMSRDHWLSDTVAASVLGFTIGDFFHRRNDDTGPLAQARFMIAPNTVAMTLPFR